MKNYPNQASTFGKLRDTLSTIKELKTDGHDVLDDGVLGYELARRRVYTFRDFDYVHGSNVALEARISQEKTKKPGNQGARTNARELRRTLIDLGWIVDDGSMTPSGEELLESEPSSDQERSLLKIGLLNLEAGDKEGINFSHPVVIMLKLLSHAPTIRRGGLELALEAMDDSDAEIARVISLYDRIRNHPVENRAAMLGVSTSTVANAVKVFPTLSKYAGLVTEDQVGTWRLSGEGMHALELGVIPEDFAIEPPQASPPMTPVQGTDPTTARRRRRLTRGRRKDVNEVGQHATGRMTPTGLTPDQQAEAQQRLQERTDAHQEIVRSFAQRIGSGTFYEDTASYDLAWVSDDADDIHLFEVKTIASDSDAQIIRAVGQLLYYSHFNVVAKFEAQPSTRTVVVNDDVPLDLCEWLDTLGIGLLRTGADVGIQSLNSRGELILDLLPVS